jgi:hypothetical protein
LAAPPALDDAAIETLAEFVLLDLPALAAAALPAELMVLTTAGDDVDLPPFESYALAIAATPVGPLLLVVLVLDFVVDATATPETPFATLLPADATDDVLVVDDVDDAAAPATLDATFRSDILSSNNHVLKPSAFWSDARKNVVPGLTRNYFDQDDIVITGESNTTTFRT